METASVHTLQELPIAAVRLLFCYLMSVSVQRS